MPATPKSKFVLGKTLYFGAAILVVMGMFEGYEYARIESSPRQMTAGESVTELQTRTGKHWVRLTGLQLDCTKPVQEITNGKLSRTFYTATDEGKPQLFILEYDGACSSDSAQTYEGILEPSAGDYIVKQVAAAGVALPAGRVPFLTVGGNPSGTWQIGLVLAGLGVVGLFGTWWSRNKS